MPNNHCQYLPLLLLPLCVFLLASCGGSDPTPKPKGYHKIDFPEKSYKRYSPANCPFTFEYPAYARVERDSAYFDRKTPNPCWLNIAFPQFSGTIHISYKQIGKDDNLPTLVEDMHKLTFKHTVKADYIDEQSISGTGNVGGILYEVGGNAASSTQFFLTDSANHFIRGALYFSTTPNQDSMAPVIRFVKEDILHMVESFKWTDSTFREASFSGS